MRIALLDDYQRVAVRMADWTRELPDCEIVAFSDRVNDEDALVARLRPFDVVVAMRERTAFPRNVIQELPRLKLLVTTGMRNASIDLEAADEARVVVSGTESLSWPAAELTWGLILALVRNIPAEDARVRGGGWQATVGAGLHRKTLGVVGLGRLGARVATIGLAFGMEVVAWSPTLTDQRAAEHGATLLTKKELVERSDVITLHAKLSAESRGLFRERELRAMQRTSYLINTARGPLVEEQALLRALYEGWIAGAGLDVFDDEPLPIDHPLRTAPNTVLTPHLGYVTVEGYELFYSQVLEDIQAFLSGSAIRQLV